MALVGGAGVIARGGVGRLLAHVRAPLNASSYALMLSSGLTSALGLLYWSLATRLYSATDVGLGAALLSAMTLAAGVAQLSLVSVMNRYLPRAGGASLRLVGGAYALSLTAGALSALAFALLAPIWSPALAFLGERPGWLFWFVAATMSWCIFTLQDSVLAGLRQTLWIPLENTLFSLAKIALLLLFAASLPGAGIFASWTIPGALVLLPVNLLIFRRLLPRHREATRAIAEPLAPRTLAAYAASNYLGSLVSLAATTLLPLVVVNRLGAEANAYFAQPWLIASSLQLVAGNVSISLTVAAASEPGRLRSYAARAFRQCARLLLPLALLIIAGAPFLLQVFGPEYAARGSLLLRLLALGALPNMVVMLAISVARVQGRGGEIVAIQLALSALVLGLSLLLIGPYGISGVGLAYLLGQSLVAAPLLLRLAVLARSRQPQGGNTMLQTIAEALSGVLGLTLSVNLLALLAQHEFALALDTPLARRLAQITQAVIVPLLIAFVVTMAVQFGAVLGEPEGPRPPTPSPARRRRASGVAAEEPGR
jgi:O-antigen/teichoic acid export membrane protein